LDKEDVAVLGLLSDEKRRFRACVFLCLMGSGRQDVAPTMRLFVG